MAMNYMSAKKRGMVKKFHKGGPVLGPASDTTGMTRAGLYPQEEKYALDHPGRSQSLALTDTQSTAFKKGGKV